jgi:hypothetical protein
MISERLLVADEKILLKELMRLSYSQQTLVCKQSLPVLVILENGLPPVPPVHHSLYGA